MFEGGPCRQAAEDQQTSNGEAPKVSVLVMAYNHAKYIEEALDSVLRQRTTASYEIVVADDCSPDRTLEKVQAVAKENPGVLRILPREKNLGICRNFVDAYGQCRGEYVAILEGDDFWHHTHKLQRHVDILDRHKKCAFVFNDIRALWEDGSIQEGLYPSYLPSKLRLRDFLADNFINCSSLTFRHRLIPSFPQWFLALPYYDWPLHVLHLQHGYAIYVRDTLSTFRALPTSAWNGSDEQTRLRGLIEIFHGLDEHFGYRYQSILRLNERYRILNSERAQIHAERAQIHTERAQLHAEIGKLRNMLADLSQAQDHFHRSKAYKLVNFLSGLKRGVLGRLSRRAG